MARIDPLDTSRSRNPIVRFSGWYARRWYKRDLEPVGVTAHHPALLAGYGGFELVLERSRRLDGRLKELGAIKAAAMSGCEWCIDFASMVGREAGFSETQLRDLPRFRESDAFNDAEKDVLEYAEAMTRTPCEVTDELFGRLRARFDEAQLVELTAAIAIENYRARFNHAFGIGAQGFSEGAFCVRPEARAEAPAGA